MKFLFALAIVSSICSISYATELKYPFCENSISSAPSEEGSIDNNKAVEYIEGLKFSLTPEVRKANAKFFKEVRSSCLDLEKIKVLSTGEMFLVYHTNKDICDGGNTFGIIVSESTHEKVAEVNDGYIECELFENK